MPVSLSSAEGICQDEDFLARYPPFLEKMNGPFFLSQAALLPPLPPVAGLCRGCQPPVRLTLGCLLPPGGEYRSIVVFLNKSRWTGIPTGILHLTSLIAGGTLAESRN
jgi:hypothetical protein